MTKKSNGIMVFCQSENGEIAMISKQLLGKGRELARQRLVPLTAAFVGYQLDGVISRAAAYGVEACYVIDHFRLKEYTAVHYAKAFELILRYAGPEIVLTGATSIGRDLAARTAMRMGTGLTADCTMLEIQKESGLLLQTRPAYGGRVTATILCPERVPQMATVREGVFPVPEAEENEDYVEVNDLSHLFHPVDSGIYVREIKRSLCESSGDALREAEVVVAGGRGVKNAGGMELVRRLADVLGGVAAASRGAVEDHLADAVRQVGQTGQTIRPKLYIACGISGASQHLAGVQCADKILAVNQDADAPIMQMADYALCGDIFEVIPELIRIAGEMNKISD